jgi:hypothetical protein
VEDVVYDLSLRNLLKALEHWIGLVVSSVAALWVA